MNEQIQSFRDLRIYQEAFKLQQDIFQASKLWPAEEKYALIDQIRRSSRSIGANIAEAWAKRLYPQHFISKLTDADGELQETALWLNTAAACGYISGTEKVKSQARLDVIGRMLGKMLAMPDKFARRLQD